MIRLAWIPLGLSLFLFFPGLSWAQEEKIPCRIIYVPTEEEVVEKMLDLAGVNKEMTDIVRSINRLIDLANAERKKKAMPHVSLKDLFGGKLDHFTPDQKKELFQALENVNKVIDKVNLETSGKMPHVTLAEVLEGKCDFAAPALVALLKEMQKKSDIVYDLGCGDGRVVCIAARKFGARGVGVDIDPARIKDCLESMKRYGVTAEQAEFRQGDALKVKDLDRATVITLYMLPEFMEKLEPQVRKLRPGTRLVSHDYRFPNIEPDQEIEFQGPHRTHTLYLWVIREGDDMK